MTSGDGGGDKQVRAGPLNVLNTPENQPIIDHIRAEVNTLRYLRDNEKRVIDGMLRWDSANKKVVVSINGEFKSLAFDE